MATPTAAQKELVKLYLAAFLRAPELSGYEYWSGQLASGKTMAQVSATIFSLDVVKAIYPATMSSTAFVSAIYQNVFGKAGDADGLAYWSSRIDTSGLNRGEVALEMINAGLGTADGTPGKAYIVNRNTAALYAVDQQTGATGELSPTYLRSQMDTVTSDAGTLTSYANTVRQAVQALGTKVIAYSDSNLVESSANDGSIATVISLVIRGDTFKGEVGAVLGTVSKLPAGLTASIVKTSDLTATLTLGGKAAAHGALSSISNLTVTFTGADLGSGSTAGLSNAVRNDLKVTFFDVGLAESGGTITGTGDISLALVIDLNTDTLTHGTSTVALRSGSIGNASDVDLSAMKPPAGVAKAATASAAIYGDSGANNLAASTYGGTINGRGGNDTLNAGPGVDRFVFASDAAANGNDTIYGFTLGAGGDILSFSAFLNKTGTSNTTIRTAASAATAVNNGDVLVYSGTVNTAADVAALFNGTVFANVTTAGKYVLITGNVTGDSNVWYIANQSTPASIDPVEITKVATLVGVNNLELVPFLPANFA